MRTKKITKIYGTKKQRLIKWLDEYIKTNRTTFTSKEVIKLIRFELNTEYSEAIIRKFMKNQMKMSFKRVKSRPTSVNLNKIKLIKSLFVVKLSKEITMKTLLINVDESSINRFVKTNYSWGCKGKPIE